MAVQYDRPHRAEETTLGSARVVCPQTVEMTEATRMTHHDEAPALRQEIADLKQQLAAALALSEERRAWMALRGRHDGACESPKKPCWCGLDRLARKEE